MKEISIKELDDNAFDLIANQWAIITVKADDKVNAMTANWVQLGYLWSQNVITTYVRRQRYTYDFIEKNNEYAICFFEEAYRKELGYLGTKSGRDFDKLKECNMTVSQYNNVDYIDQARLVFICEKIYVDDIREEKFIDKNIIADCYPNKDFHKVYVSRIKHILVKEN